MCKPQLGSMKEVSAGLPILLNKLPISGFTVHIVPRNRMPNGAEVNPNLVGTPRLDPNFKEGKGTNLFNRSVCAQRRAAPSLLHAHSGPYLRMSSDIQSDFSGWLRHPSMHESKVKFLYGALLKRPAQPEEIAPAFVFLAAPSCSSYITGEILPIVGGYA